MSSAKPLKKYILELLKTAGLQEVFEKNLALVHWASVVGAEIASHTEPIKVEEDILFVRTDSDVWRNELLFLKQDILTRLNEKIGKRALKDIRFY